MARNSTTDTCSKTTIAAAAGLEHFHPVVAQWFSEAFEAPTRAQTLAWPAIATGSHTLLLAPTGSGKTLAAFLVAINRLMFDLQTPQTAGVRVLYISPLKALGVDIERNLRPPLAGVRAVAEREGVAYRMPRVAVRSGDTGSDERRQIVKHPPDILITTPESLYLMLTSRARQALTDVEVVIIDEIHCMVASKRGAHLFASLERLERLQRLNGSGDSPAATPLQRIGLSATQRPLEEVARLLGGSQWNADHTQLQRRNVQIVDAGQSRQLEITIEMPAADLATYDQPEAIPTGPAASAPTPPSIWPSIHPRLVELIRQHRSTMIFANSRRLAERLATAINELAEEELALAHHGSIAKATRRLIEDRLKCGQLPAIVATSSLELGIDMGAVDLVIQIEAPPSIASGIQRVGRSGHHVGGLSSGIVFPKYRGDLLACSAASRRMISGDVESTYYPRNPLDVLAQQIVAMAALEPVAVDEVFDTLRCAAPFHDLSRGAFEGVLDMLSGRYPSDEFAELRPRLTWDRLQGVIQPRRGSQQLAVVNAGTIPDRGLYGVFLAAEGDAGGSRVGELDEEMVFETRTGDVFLLGASSWRVMDITHDRVLVVPAPGEPGRMPFWRGDGPGRPFEFGRAIGQLARQLAHQSRPQAVEQLTTEHGLSADAAEGLWDYVQQQVDATEEPPSDATIIVESFLDEVGDWRVCVLTPFGARVHAPWATAVAGRLRQESLGEVDLMWADDGMVFRLPQTDQPPDADWFFPDADEIQSLVVRELGGTALFAARFRENAARALLLPRRRPGRRSPLWMQRRRAADLLEVASRYPDFPILLETYRECLRDVFDIDGLRQILRSVQDRSIRVRSVPSQQPSPFAAALLFNYTANFLYEGDAPLAERRAQTLALDHAQLRELLGDAELRELLDAEAVDELGLELQRLDGKYPVRDADGLHDLLLALGDLSREEIGARCEATYGGAGLDRDLPVLLAARRIVPARMAGQQRYIAAEDAARYRDALGVVPPLGMPEALLQPVAAPLEDLISRYARTHIPFRTVDVARRFGLGTAPVQMALEQLRTQDRMLEGQFLPGGRGQEWCDPQVLKTLKRRSLARLRKQVEPVSAEALARLLPLWHGVHRPRRGLDAVLDAIEQLQGLPLSLLALQRDILPLRVVDFRPQDLDELSAAGEIIWRGWEPVAGPDGRIALYLTDHWARLAPDSAAIDDPLALQVEDVLAGRGGLFFHEICQALDAFPNTVLESLWQLVWAGRVTNDTLAPLRARLQPATARRRSRQAIGSRSFRTRRQSQPAGCEGRWSLLPDQQQECSSTERQTAIVRQLLRRYGILTREMVAAEGVVGGFAGLYPILKAMEETGKIRRGYFVAGLGAAQFAESGADDRLRDCEHLPDLDQPPLVLAATDPANPYGTVLPWPETAEQASRPQRATGTRVVLWQGRLIGYLNRNGEQLTTFLPDDPVTREPAAAALLAALQSLARPGQPVYLTTVDGQTPSQSGWSERLQRAGFTAGSRGYLLRATEAITSRHARR